MATKSVKTNRELGSVSPVDREPINGSTANDSDWKDARKTKTPAKKPVLEDGAD